MNAARPAESPEITNTAIFTRPMGTPEKPLASVDELEQDDADADAAAAAATDQDGTGAGDAPDALLTESGNILLDAIQLNQRIATSN